MTMSDHGARLDELRRALEAAIAEPTAPNMRALAEAYQVLELSDGDGDDATERRNDATEFHVIDSLGRRLVMRLGPSAPGWLRRYALGEEDGPPASAIVYECPVCGEEIESAPGLRARCSNKHPPAELLPRR